VCPNPVTKQEIIKNELKTKLLAGLCPGQLITTNKCLAAKSKRSVKKQTNPARNVQGDLKYGKNDH
jgi:hypothetical protein